MSWTTRRLLAFLLVIVASPASAGTLVVSWDGTRPDVVQELLAQGRLPHLAGLIARGQWHDLTFTDQLPDYGTVTKPGHSQMLTGLTWRETGVKTNRNWVPLAPGITLPERWKAHGARVGWVVAKKHLDATSPFANAWQIADCRLYARDADPVTVLAPFAVSCLADWTGQPWFFFWHSGRPDFLGHKFGVASRQYRDGLVQNDRALGMLLAAISEVDQVVVTTDHSFGRGNGTPRCAPEGHTHSRCPEIWAVTAPGLRLGGRLLDIAPALQPRGPVVSGFMSGAMIEAEQSPRWVVEADFDADGHQDLAVANRESNTVSMLFGDGAGGFDLPLTWGRASGIGSGPQSLAAIDVNGDGLLDLVVTNLCSNFVSILINTGTFALPQAPPVVDPDPNTFTHCLEGAVTHTY